MSLTCISLVSLMAQKRKLNSKIFVEPVGKCNQYLELGTLSAYKELSTSVAPFLNIAQNSKDTKAFSLILSSTPKKPINDFMLGSEIPEPIIKRRPIKG